MEKGKLIQKRLNESEIIELGKFNELIDKEESNSRVCPDHKLSVVYEYELTNNPIGVPFNVILSGCCENAIKKEFEFINLKLKENQQV